MNRERREIAYSLIIIVVIPLLFVVNTLLIANRIRNDANRSIRRNADQVNGVMAESLRSAVESNNSSQISEQIINIKKQQPSIGSIFVVTKNSDGFEIAARTDDALQKLSQNDKLQLSIIFDRARSTAKRFDVTLADGSTVNGWNVITPLVDASDKTKVEAAISTNVLTSDTQELIDKTLMISFIVTGITVLIIIVLLFHHLRFVGYANLLRRQKEVNQTMSDFLSVATHELKAPMTIIKGYITNVIEGNYGSIEEKVKEPLGIAVAQTERLNNLVQDLLSVSRIEQGRINFEMTNVDVKTIVTTLVKSYADKASSAGLELIYLPQDVPLIYADEGRVQEIMTNLNLMLDW